MLIFGPLTFFVVLDGKWNSVGLGKSITGYFRNQSLEKTNPMIIPITLSGQWTRTWHSHSGLSMVICLRRHDLCISEKSKKIICSKKRNFGPDVAVEQKPLHGFNHRKQRPLDADGALNRLSRNLHLAAVNRKYPVQKRIDSSFEEEFRKLAIVEQELECFLSMDGITDKDFKDLEAFSNYNTVRSRDTICHRSAGSFEKEKQNWSRRHRFLREILLSDWAFLAVLGISVSIISVGVDQFVSTVQKVQRGIVAIGDPDNEELFNISYVLWILYTVGLVLASSAFVHAVSPQAIGSGIPEMKTIIRGVQLRDYLSFKALISKVVGIALSIGSGVPIGVMGPFVHIASIVANQMSLLAGNFDPVFLSETRRAECLAAASAVGISSTFSLPVGGVLFAIEVTTMYFSVRSYWRGFFAASCGAVTIRLLRGFVAQSEVTVNAFFQTAFKPDAFTVEEMPLFVVLGAICGLMGAFYVRFYTGLVMFLRNHSTAKRFFQRHLMVYPLLVTFIYSLFSFPHGIGNYTTGRLKFSNNLRDFFSTCTFTQPYGAELACPDSILEHWKTNSIYALVLFLAFHYFFSLFFLSLPHPCGIFMPIFVIGATTGRLIGEILSVFLTPAFTIHPGIYAVVGAAAFSASVTHSVSVSVMIFEITGQLHFILPVVIAVVIAKAVAAYFQPSFFDATIKIKHLPFLPDIPPTKNVVHTTYAENFMISPVKSVPKKITFADLRSFLIEEETIRILPVISDKESQMLVGTVTRKYLLELLDFQIGEHARRLEAEMRVKKAIEMLDEHRKQIQILRTKSESSLEVNLLHSQRGLEIRAKEAEDASSDGRFLIVPVANLGIRPPRRNAFCSLYSGPSTCDISFTSSLEEVEHIPERKTNQGVKSYIRQAKRYLRQMHHSKKDDSESLPFDLTEEERLEWEKERLKETLELTDEDIDPAPFQLTPKTSLFRVHSIFSMLQLVKAYVTDCGRLVGVVSLTDLRQALERSETETVSEKPASRKEKLLVTDILTPMPEVIRPPTTQMTVDSRNLDPTILSNRRKSLIARTQHASLHRRRLGRQASFGGTSTPSEIMAQNHKTIDFLRKTSNV